MGGTWKVNGDAVKALREDLLLTQADVAQRSGVSERTISDIEQGHRPKPQNKTILVLAQVLEVGTDLLMESPDGKERLAKTLRARQDETHGNGYGAAWDQSAYAEQAAFAER